MNERIKELALAAFKPINDIATEGVADFHTFQQPWFQLYNKEFAELIVKECAKHCDLLLDKKISSEWSRGTHDCSRAIKKHLGVTE
tara:strand:+ start:233 stop:490 length:258 start_codon:yes stop_codon:yes gene_type:complete